MDAVEVRMRCLELVSARGGQQIHQIIEAVQSLEKFVMAAGVAQPAQNSDNGSSNNEAPAT